MSDTPVSRAPAASRTVALLTLLARSRTPLTLSQLATGLDMLPSSCLNILRELVSGGLVERDEATKQYAVGLEVLPLAHRHLLQNRLARASQVELDRLRRAFNCTALVTQRRRIDHSVCIAVAGSPVSVSVQIGRAENAFASASGRVVLAFENYDDELLLEIFKGLTWHDAPQAEPWLSEVRKVREIGYAHDNGQYRAGLMWVATPILSDLGTLAGVLSVGFRSSEATHLDFKSLTQDVKASARNITLAVGDQSH